MAPIRNAVHIVGADYFPVYTEKLDPRTMLEKYESRAGSMSSNLVRWAYAFKKMRIESKQ